MAAAQSGGRGGAGDNRDSASAGEDGFVQLWNRNLERPAVRVQVEHVATAVAVSLKRALLASFDSQGTLQLWDAKTGTSVKKIHVTGGPASQLVFTGAGDDRL